MVSVACLCSLGTVYNCKDKLASYTEFAPTAVINSDINFSTDCCSMSVKESKLDPMFDILHGNSLFPIAFPKWC